MTDDPDLIRKRLATYGLLGQMWREQQIPAQTEIRLTADGWELFGGEIRDKPLPVHVDMAYELAGYDQQVLDKTREMCGRLRIRAKKDKRAAEILSDLRAGLERARIAKANRQEAA